MTVDPQLSHAASVDLFWIPLGAGDAAWTVRSSGCAYEAFAARCEHRARRDLYHSALEVRCDAARFVIEMTPVWGSKEPNRGVVAEGPVGLPWLGRSRLFRYEVRCWRDGRIPDVSEAVGGSHPLGADRARARRLLNLVPLFPTATWGLVELDVGEMWNSNSLVASLLARSGHDTCRVRPPRLWTGARLVGGPRCRRAWHALAFGRVTAPPASPPSP